MDIKQIGQEMLTQDNRGTQYPLYAIQVDKKTYVHYEDEWDGKERIEETDEEKLCETCLTLHANDQDMDDDCEECDTDAFHYYKEGKEFDLRAGVFFTAMACEEHIKANKHHYDNPKSYAISAWRNYEMHDVMQFLLGNTGYEIPSHYR